MSNDVAHTSSQPSIASIIHELRVSGDPTEEAWADQIARLTERCEQYKGQVKAGSDEIDALRARVRELEGALRGLTNSADGLSFAERDMRLAVGNTNWSVLRHWIEIARTALSPDGNSGEGK